jgi:glucuronyl/N-acetylglucosaminyl transferase EXT2
VVCLLLSGVILSILTIASHQGVPSVDFGEEPERVSVKQLNWTGLDHSCKTKCRFHTCFDVNRCVFSLEDTLGVHVGGAYEFHDPKTPHPTTPVVSAEYAELVAAVKGSRYHVSDPAHACVFIPPLDTLVRPPADVVTTSLFLNSLPQ